MTLRTPDNAISIRIEKPPIYQDVIDAGLRFNPDTTVFAYLDAIYNPGDVNLPDHIIVHECVHLKQQGGTEESAKAWWVRYIQDGYFRIQQEVEAYATQYAFLCKTFKDRNMRDKILNDFANILSGPMYGNFIVKSEARRLIKLTSNI